MDLTVFICLQLILKLMLKEGKKQFTTLVTTCGQLYLKDFLFIPYWILLYFKGSITLAPSQNTSVSLALISFFYGLQLTTEIQAEWKLVDLEEGNPGYFPTESLFLIGIQTIVYFWSIHKPSFPDSVYMHTWGSLVLNQSFRSSRAILPTQIWHGFREKRCITHT